MNTTSPIHCLQNRSQVKRAASAGFTLIELLVVVSILGILAAIGLTKFYVYKQKAHDALAESDLRNSITAQEAKYADQEVYGNCATALACEAELPGFICSKDSGGASLMSLFEHTPTGAESFTASAKHRRGHYRFDYTSLNGTFSFN